MGLFIHSLWRLWLLFQFIRFLRRTEGIEAARKYFLDARKSPNCTYHVYVAYAMMAFCLDKDPKVDRHFRVSLFISFFLFPLSYCCFDAYLLVGVNNCELSNVFGFH